MFELQKEYCAPSTKTRNANIDNRFCEEIENLFVQAKFNRTFCIWTLHGPKEVNIAIVILTISHNQG